MRKSTNSKTEYLDRGSVDPFEPVKLLGRGRSEVWKVVRKDDQTIVYARKQFLLPVQPNKKQFQSIQKEVSIMKRLSHSHIIQFVEGYQLEGNNLYYILLHPVADANLKEFLDRMCRFSANEPGRLEACRAMCEWPTCLFRALDYTHSMSIRHKDIKLGNILIKDMRVYLTDFGISNDFRDLTTSKTEGTVGAMTRRYIAPEIDDENRRGRATDIWALGCVLVELCTVASGENSIKDLNEHLRGLRTSSMTPPFCESPYLLFRWIWLLSSSPGPDPWIGLYIRKLLQLAFLMLDPLPTDRVTSRQLVDLISDPRRDYFHLIASSACTECQNNFGTPARDIPPHSVFRTESNGNVFLPSRQNLSAETPKLWEEIKRRWLKSHIFWTDTK
jgi:serine/threonine protein kinase